MLTTEYLMLRSHLLSKYGYGVYHIAKSKMETADACYEREGIYDKG